MCVKKIIIHLKTHHKRLWKIIKRYHSTENTILRAIAIIIVSLALSNIIPMSTTAKENLKQHQTLEKMREIDNIAHQWDNLLETLPNGYNPERDKHFHIIDHLYHIAQKKEEKYKAAQDLYLLVQEQKQFLEHMNKIDTSQKERFEQLEKEITQLSL